MTKKTHAKKTSVIGERTDADKDQAAKQGEPNMLKTNQDGDWVDDSLRKLYTSTLEEDIPQDMLSLLDQLDEAAGSNPMAASRPEREGEK